MIFMGFFSSLFGKSQTNQTQTVQSVSVQKQCIDLQKVLDEENKIIEASKNLSPEIGIRSVLILPVSTFNGPISINTYKSENMTGLYASQMEPVAKYLGSTVKLDQIILLTTNKSSNEKKTVEELGLTSYPKNSVTAVEFLKDRLACVFGETDSRKCDFVEVSMQDDKENYITEKVVYNIISELEKNEGHVNIYMDIHGGFRDNQIVLSGIMSLLKDDYRLHIKKIYSLQYDPYEKAGIIVDSSDKLDIFEFTSGMSEFVKFGSATSFDLFNQNKNNTPVEKEFISLLNKISDAISMCNMNAFDEYLVELKNKKDVFAEELKETYYGIFLTRLINQYRIMSNGKRYNLLTTAGGKWDFQKFTAQVSWCLNKGMAQQALTIIESKTSEVLENEKIIYSADEYEKMLESKEQKIKVRKKPYNHEDSANTTEYFENWIYLNITDYAFTSKEIYKSKNFNRIGKNESDTTAEKYNEFRNYVFSNMNSSADLYCLKPTPKNEDEKILIPFVIDKNISKNNKKILIKDIYVFGALFKKIKWLRNSVNHASEKNSVTFGELTDLCEMLIYSIKVLLQDYKQKGN